MVVRGGPWGGGSLEQWGFSSVGEGNLVQWGLSAVYWGDKDGVVELSGREQ